MLITPAQVHISLEVVFRAGVPPTITVGEPGAHGAVVTGIQGIGVSTPDAADVADATVGLARLVHIPKGAMFTIGALSIIVAANILFAFVSFPFGSTLRALGVTPNEHCIIAPITTN